MFTLRETVDRLFGSKSLFSLIRSFASLPSCSRYLLLCSRLLVLNWDIHPAKPAISSLLRFRVSSLRVLQLQLSQHLFRIESGRCHRTRLVLPSLLTALESRGGLWPVINKTYALVNLHNVCRQWAVSFWLDLSWSRITIFL